jgi:hypothetical protein
MEQKDHYYAACSCGKVGIAVKGNPVAMGYCHCNSCRQWSAAPVTAFTLWAPEAMSITRGAEHIGTYNKTDRSARKWCKSCGGHLFTEHPSFGLIDLYPAAMPQFPFAPGVHVHYEETVLRIRDGLPKLGDLPKEMGGSGMGVPE